jgi:hypothetical protein
VTVIHVKVNQDIKQVQEVEENFKTKNTKITKIKINKNIILKPNLNKQD